MPLLGVPSYLVEAMYFTPAIKGVSTSQHMSHSMILLSCYLADDMAFPRSTLPPRGRLLASLWLPRSGTAVLLLLPQPCREMRLHFRADPVGQHATQPPQVVQDRPPWRLHLG